MDQAHLPRTQGMDWLATRAADPEEPRFHVQQDLDSYGFRSGAPPAKEGEAQDDAAPKHGAADVADTTRAHRSCPAKVIEFVARLGLAPRTARGAVTFGRCIAVGDGARGPDGCARDCRASPPAVRTVDR